MSSVIPNLLLSDENFLRRDFDAHVAAGHHDGVGHGDDFVQVFHSLDVKRKPFGSLFYFDMWPIL